MKTPLIAIVLTFAIMSATAAEKIGYSNAMDGYSPDGKFYYAGIRASGNSKGLSKGLFSMGKGGDTILNVQIFDLARNTSKKLFPKDLRDGLTVLSILFPPHPDTGSGNRYFRNVNPVGDGPKKALLLVFLPGTTQKSRKELWSMQQDGGHLKKITEVPHGKRWHVDVANQKIRVFTMTGDAITQETFDW